ncbi:molybdopterin-guanine dinucleotide biosynthesis protein B [Maribellus sediminis]|uniref:molybdopterin-guanine dinucleotide biosynthesis protein B n=1 Tax=Maribellus sediminis TaxID=2696285 RepID=UPI001430F376|nr:molybdopterin-guanine dinucleotide biosynthesis protein B [Maribellus sediminis]
MNISKLNTRVTLPNMLLISGNGRNVGKTTLACKIIAQLSKSVPVTGIKISAHFHPYSDAGLVAKNKHFVILKEQNISPKDSSMMLQAGASDVYFVMAQKEHFNKALNELLKLLPEQALVCESGGLHEWIDPGIFLFVNLKNKPVEKTHLLEYEPIIVENDGKNFNIDFEAFQFSNGRIQLLK